jgi:tryptophanyl-tRNA synthetase
MTLQHKRDSTSVISLENLTDDTIILTGDRPTGPLHLGHYVGSLRNRLTLQERFTQFVLIADVQALTDNFAQPEKVRENVIEVMLDYLAVGLDPNKSTLYLASAVPETAELTLYFCNLVNLGKLQRNPTVKKELQSKNFADGLPVGFMIYPINQAADITQFGANVVPVGEDQIPMIEQANDIVGRFNELYSSKNPEKKVLQKCRALIGSTELLPGTDGGKKMGKSLGNAIFLSDSTKEVQRKVKAMYTDPNHVRVEDPGSVIGNPVFAYLEQFASESLDLPELKAHYQRGGLGDGVLKQHLIAALEEFLSPIRERRAEYAQDKGEVLNVLKKGTMKARQEAAKTLSHVKRSMGLDLL